MAHLCMALAWAETRGQFVRLVFFFTSSTLGTELRSSGLPVKHLPQRSHFTIFSLEEKHVKIVLNNEFPESS